MKTKMTLLCAAVLNATSVFTVAQEATTNTNNDANESILMEKIVVTAQKRIQSLKDTPVAITALSSEKMNELGIVSQQDISNFTPSMSYQEEAGGNEGNRIYMRGVGRETSVLGTEPGVGIYDNGFYTGEAGVLSASPDRVARIEILRGPQGTLYGRNTTAGAITVIAKGPADEFEGTARLNIGSYNNLVAELTVSGPISESVRYFVNYRNRTQDSFYTNVSGPDPIGLDEEYVEAQLDVDFSDDVNWNLRYFKTKYENESLRMQVLGQNFNNSPLKLGAIVVNPELFSSLAVSPSVSDPFDIDSDVQGKVILNGDNNYQSTLNVEFNHFSLKALNGYSERNWNSTKDYDGTSSPVSFLEKVGQTDWSMQHEIQLVSNGDSDINWVTGLFFYKNDVSQPYSILDEGNPFIQDGSVVGGPNPDSSFYEQLGELKTETTALYGQIDWDASDKLVLTAGLRYSEDKKTGRETQQIHYDTLGCGFNILPGVGNPFTTNPAFAFVDYSAFVASGNPLADACPSDANPRFGLELSNSEALHEASWDAVTWRLGANWSVNDDSQLYATISSGYKSGGFRLGGMQDDPSTEVNESIVDEETLISYEVGYKANLLQTLTVNMAVYQYQYKDMQVEVDVLNESGLATSLLTNAPKVDISGFEFEGNWAATDKLSFLVSYSFNDSEIKEDYRVGDNKTFPTFGSDEPLIRNVKGNRLNRSPKNKFAVGAYYVQPFTRGTLVASATYASIDRQYVTIFNDNIESIPSYNKTDLRLSWKDNDDKYEISVYGKNITDEVSYANGYSVRTQQESNRATGRTIAPRTFGAELVYRF